MSSVLAPLNPRTLWRRKFLVHYIAGVEHVRRFKAQHLCFFICAGAMLDSTGHQYTVTRSQLHNMIAKFHPKISAPDKKEFIGIRMMVPRKFPPAFDQFDFLSV
jgi:hypothetical protein